MYNSNIHYFNVSIADLIQIVSEEQHLNLSQLLDQHLLLPSHLLVYKVDHHASQHLQHRLHLEVELLDLVLDHEKKRRWFTSIKAYEISQELHSFIHGSQFLVGC
jgi:hypothetical protein